MIFNFSKLSGLGNDFILFDNRDVRLTGTESSFFQKICQRRTGIGADGVILLENSIRATFKYRHFNADGSVAEMCGNGARSICYFAVTHRIAPPDHTFEINETLYKAQVQENQIMLTMPPPTEIRKKIDIVTEPELEEGGFVQVGVPHLVVLVPDVQQVDVAGLGFKYRHHPAFASGANVNFVECIDSNTIRIRTYERGVEAETLACGTGSTAAAIIACLKKDCQLPLQVINPGGTLTLNWDADFNPVYMIGPAKIVYQGNLNPADFY